MFNSKLAALIEDAVKDCIAFGRGQARHSARGTVYDVTADWAENETDIEITIKENDIIRLTFTEPGPDINREGGDHMKSYVEQLSEHYGWPLKIHARGYDAYLVGISAGSFPIYRFPGGDSLVSECEMVPAEEDTP